MRAAVLHAPGPPEAFRIEEVSQPAPGPEDVLVEVRACGVSHRDVVERNGTYRRDVEFPEAACTLGPASGVALNAVRDVARVTIRESVLVTGGTGGVGWPAIQLAKLAGARVIATTRSASKAAALAESGADEVVVAADGADFSGEVRRLTGGQGVDVVIDTVGTRVFNAAFDSLAVHGRYALVGQLFGEDAGINLARIFFKRAQLVGVGSVSRAQLEDVIALAAAGTLTPRIARTLPLEGVAEAHRLVEAGSLVGRVVLIPR